MAVSISISFEGDKQLAKRLADIDIKAKSPRPFYMMYGAYMKQIPARAIKEQADPVTLRGWPRRRGISEQARRKGPGKTLDDTGHLRKSLNASPIVTAGGVSIGTNVPYAITHQKGMTITAKGKKLTIPMTPEAAKSGGIRAWAAKHSAQKPFFFESRSGTVFMAYMEGARRGRKGKLTLAWMLKDKVVIPQRRFLGFGKRDKDKFVEIAEKYFRSGGTA